MDLSKKRCKICERVRGSERFYRSKKHTDGRNTTCKDCIRVQLSTPEEMEKKRIRATRYRERNSEQVKVRVATWHEDNKEHVIEYRRNYYLANKETILYKNAIYRNDNKEEMAVLKHLWYLRNVESEKEKTKEWARNNPDKVAATQQRYRARLRGYADTLTAEELKGINERFGYSCALSGRTGDLTLDHVVPLSVSDVGTVRGNILPLTRTLNSSKNNRDLFEWYSTFGEVYGLSGVKFNEAVSFIAKENGMSVKEYETYYKSLFKGDHISSTSTGK